MNVGVRTERWEHFATTGENIDTVPWEFTPRLSAAYDIFGDGKHKASADAEGNTNSDSNADFQGDVDFLDPRAPNQYATQPGLIKHSSAVSPTIRRVYCSVRTWQSPHVKAGGRYPIDEGQVVVDSITRIRLKDITYDLARESGFASAKELLETARHGSGRNVYLVRFRYLPPGAWDVPA